MTTPQFVDISAFQPENIDWQAYKAWSASGDGVSRVAMRSSYGVGYVDTHFQTYREGALSAGIDMIIFYHYSYPQTNNAISEAKWQKQVVGGIRSADMLILDFEENVPQATAEWAYAWLAQQEDSYGKPPGIYAGSAYIAQRLNDSRLAQFSLWLANWQYTPDERPPVPAPWSSCEFVQYTDKAVNIPGIASVVDADIFLGGNTLMSNIPEGWADDGTTLTAPNKIPVVLGFRDRILADPTWSPDNWPLGPEQHLTGLEQSNPSLGDGQSQLFRWKRLEYTAKMGIFEGWLGQELAWYQKQVALQDAQIAALQASPSVTNLLAVNALAAQIVQKTTVQ